MDFSSKHHSLKVPGLRQKRASMKSYKVSKVAHVFTQNTQTNDQMGKWEVQTVLLPARIPFLPDFILRPICLFCVIL
jgi:hypothetical protein